ncbi:MAG: HU family DNA-binding protein [Mediterranea sp.]|jgi:predicted histone-like DNA-binding protein|nr:HU family DNA-binding protein [Mediterranea sp.]
MSIPYVVRQKANVLNSEKKGLWYATAKKLQKKGGGVTEDDLAWKIANRTGFSRGEIKGILTELADAIEEALSMGRSVTIKDIGSFQTALTSKGFKRPIQITPGEVSVSRVYFIADRGLTARLKEVKCTRIPLKYYLPKEMLTKEMLEEEEDNETGSIEQPE